MIKEIYKAVAVDPRIASDEALLEALVMAGAGGTGRKAPGGSLDLDFAWSVILRQPDLMNQRPDLVEILRWRLDPERWTPVQALDPQLVPSFFEWVAERAGEVAHCLESLFLSEQTNLYLPLGLVAGDLFDERLDAVLAGKKIAEPVTRSFGCSTKWLFKKGSVAKDQAAWEAPERAIGPDRPACRLVRRSFSEGGSLLDLRSLWRSRWRRLRGGEMGVDPNGTNFRAVWDTESLLPSPEYIRMSG